VTYVESDVDHLPFLVLRCIHIPEVLDARLHVNPDVPLVGLAEGLNFFGPSPDAVLSRLRYPALELLPLVLNGDRRTNIGRRHFGSGGPSWRPALSAHRCREIYEVILISCHVVCQAGADLLEMAPISVQLVGQGIIEAVA